MKKTKLFLATFMMSTILTNTRFGRERGHIPMKLTAALTLMIIFGSM